LLHGFSPAYSQVSKSKEFPNVFHSPAADSTPRWISSVLQMEVVVKKGESDPQIQYVNGTVVSKDGLIVSVLDEPGANKDKSGGIASASVLLLDGSGVAAQFVTFEPAYGIAIFHAKGLEVRPLTLSKAPPVANQRANWHTVYKDGRRTYLYTRPLRVHKVQYQMAETEDLCQIIDPGTSALSEERTGSALIGLDGTLLGIMGYQKHWNVTPKNSPPRRKLAWAVPGPVIARLLEEAKGEE